MSGKQIEITFQVDAAIAEQVIEITDEGFKDMTAEEIRMRLADGRIMTSLGSGGELFCIEDADGNTQFKAIGKIVNTNIEDAVYDEFIVSEI